MAYLVENLITNSYYLSAIVARNLEQVSGDQLSDALRWLNAILSFKSVDTRLIPYFTQYNLNLIAQQQTYFIANLIYAETVTFYINSVRYSTRYNSRKEFWGSAQALNTYSLPYNWNIQREKGGATISFYFVPDQAYPVQIWGKFGLQNVILTDDVDAVYDPYYVEYLKYALAEYICSEYGVLLPPQAQRQLDMYEEQLITVSPRDFSMDKLSSLQRDSSINYGDINIGRGYRPPG